MAARTAYTIGFTKRSAEEFFGTLRSAGIKRLVDVRLNNVSQIAGFSKREDLRFFLAQICGAEYVHELRLAPTPTLLEDRLKHQLEWGEYERRFLELLAEREAERRVDRALFDVPTVLLCSERSANQCHRRLVLEYLQSKWGDLEVVHL